MSRSERPEIQTMFLNQKGVFNVKGGQTYSNTLCWVLSCLSVLLWLLMGTVPCYFLHSMELSSFSGFCCFFLLIMQFVIWLGNFPYKGKWFQIKVIGDDITRHFFHKYSWYVFMTTFVNFVDNFEYDELKEMCCFCKASLRLARFSVPRNRQAVRVESHTLPRAVFCCNWRDYRQRYRVSFA